MEKDAQIYNYNPVDLALYSLGSLMKIESTLFRVTL
jgi:hypothetical protein